MEIKSFAYLLLLLVYLIVPVVLSTQKKICFVSQLRYFLPAIMFSVVIFVMWDIRFAQTGIWTFNPQCFTNVELLKLPVEEWLSFLLISLSSAYIYEWLKAHFNKFEKPNVFVAVSLVLLVITGILSYVFRARMFSFFTFFLLTIYFGYTVFRNRFKKYYTNLYLTWLIALIPFLFISAVLNTFPAITYDVNHIIGVAICGVPVERVAYLFLLLLINTTIYEYLNNRKKY